MSRAVPRDWTLSAKCAGMGDVFFADDADQRRIRRFCMDCPVRIECLAEAMENRIEWGIWGGTTERERRRIFRRQGALRAS